MLLCLGNLVGQVGLAVFQLCHLGAVRRGLAGDLLDGSFHLGLLGLQVGLLAFQAGLGRFLGGLTLFQGRLGVGNFLAGLGQLIHDLVVIVHDFGDGIHLVQQVRKAAGVEDNGPVGHIAPLFHAPHALAECLVILGFLFLGGSQLALLLSDHLAVLCNGLFGHGDLTAEDVDLLLQQELLVEGGVLGVGQLIQLFLDVRLLGA